MDIPALICIAGILVSIMLVNNRWFYGVIYYRYQWFYLFSFLLLGITVTDILLKRNKRFSFCFNRQDVFVLLFALFLTLHYFLFNPGAVNTYQTFVVLIIGYFCYRYWFFHISGLTKIVSVMLLSIGNIEVIWGALQIYKVLPSPHQYYLVTGSFPNPGPYGGFLSICLPIALYLFLSSKNRFLKGYSFVSLVSLFSMLPASMSRAAWIAAFIGCCLVLCIYYQGRIKNFYHRHTKQFVILAIAAICLLGIFSVFAFYLKENSVLGRLLVWKLCMYLLVDSKFLGVGLGCFSAAYGNEQIEYFSTSSHVAPLEERLSDFPDYAFNEFIQIFVELGIVGFILLMMIFVSVFIKGIKERSDLGFLGGLTAVFMFALFSYPFRILPTVIVVIILLAGCCVSRGVLRKQPTFSYLYCVLLFISIPLWKNRLDYIEALKVWSTATQIEDKKRGYSYLSDQKAYLFDQINILMAEKKYSEANQILDQMLEFYAAPIFYIMKASIHQKFKEYQLAEDYYLKAHHLTPSRFYPCYLLALLYYDLKDWDKATYWGEMVLHKNVIVMSDAIVEMQQSMKVMLNEINRKKDNV